jgi:hypothetical protein
VAPVNEERLGTPKQFAEELARHLARIDRRAGPSPSDQELAQLVDVMFFASLHEEEARRSAFNVAWQPSSGGCAAVVALAAPVPATPKSLTRLAPATRQEATSIAVRAEGGELVAWALLQPGPAEESPLVVRVLAPGVLRVDHGGIPRALYARGEILLLGGEHEVVSPARRLTATFRTWSDGADPAVAIDLRAAVVTGIAARALEHGHGGMILVVPAELPAPRGVRVHYAVGEGGDLLARRFEEVVRGVAPAERLERLRGSRPRASGGRPRVRDEAQIALAEAIELVARLTAVDNALLVDTDLHVRGFGVQVLEGDAPATATTFEHASPYSGDVHVDDLSTFKGTRHPAGVIFCMRQEREAAAIIASQDGRLSLAARDPRGVVEVVGSYERAFGWR